MKSDLNSFYLGIAKEEARKAEKKDEVPVGAVLVFENRIISKGHNLRHTKKDVLGHAEIVAILKAQKKLGVWNLTGCQLYVTLEPCPMCAAVIGQSRIQSVFYGASDPKGGVCSLGIPLHNHPKLNHRYTLEHLPDAECSQMLSAFFKAKRAKKN